MVCVGRLSHASKTATSVTCIVEDWLRYNTFASATGNGITTGALAVFSLNEKGVHVRSTINCRK